MSHIGLLEQYSLSSILQRLETHAKTGLLTVKSIQDNRTQVVELYFRQGSLMYAGPARSDQMLGQRLVEDNLISASMLQEALLTIGPGTPTETQLALTLIDRGAVTQELLRAWATAKVRIILQTLLQLSQGSLDFEEDILPPPGSLLVTLSISSLLTNLTAPKLAPQPAQPDVAPMSQQAPQQTSDVAYTANSMSTSSASRQPLPAGQLPFTTPVTSSVERIPTLTGADQFLNSAPADSSLASTESKDHVPSIFDVGHQLGWEAPQSARTEQSEPATPPAGLASPFARPSSQPVQTPQLAAPMQAASLPVAPAQTMRPAPSIRSLQSTSMPRLAAPPALTPAAPSFPPPSAAPQTPPPDEDSPYVSLGLVATDSLSFSFADDEPEPARAPVPTSAPAAPPIIPRRIDTSFMQPDMLLLPADLSAFREKNPTVQLTPDQWRLLTRINGHVTLQMACDQLRMPPDQVCSVAGELLSVGLILLSASASNAIISQQHTGAQPRESSTSPIHNGYTSAPTPAYPPLTPAGAAAPSTGPVYFDASPATTGSYRQSYPGPMPPATSPQAYATGPRGAYTSTQQDSRRALI